PLTLNRSRMGGIEVDQESGLHLAFIFRALRGEYSEKARPFLTGPVIVTVFLVKERFRLERS
ncbi:MAG: hypothetical protein U9N00_05645, partial [Candidatus Bipolaricaulota bacterium]|nr:hypothetical protein [Candidatus Bipolaricaulota bacterium]